MNQILLFTLFKDFVNPCCENCLTLMKYNVPQTGINFHERSSHLMSNFHEKPWKTVRINIMIFHESSWTMVAIWHFPPTLMKIHESLRLNSLGLYSKTATIYALIFQMKKSARPICAYRNIPNKSAPHSFAKTESTKSPYIILELVRASAPLLGIIRYF